MDLSSLDDPSIRKQIRLLSDQPTIDLIPLANQDIDCPDRNAARWLLLYRSANIPEETLAAINADLDDEGVSYLISGLELGQFELFLSDLIEQFLNSYLPEETNADIIKHARDLRMHSIVTHLSHRPSLRLH